MEGAERPKAMEPAVTVAIQTVSNRYIQARILDATAAMTVSGKGNRTATGSPAGTPTARPMVAFR